ncbi:MAG: hypothetical protein COT71_01815 [Candidatus Andersenbacteria bacterium CG10_big_fil_rev_8_21_14_0_10_54_11]|uniref:Phytanoyl-CoA dioxygenase n=1 Tax=Candidatus Andersenbacteria bacterium CG10_big_fil_rev_8_21_14_0_10_54_11 TaxID=1974485 RepID=A0A2M6WZM9_9BACT|nr:MAG: hypothetical protein COT71_01815 [Candidatus Andersenbacteria bacterium CG10_big_fil_rev_8_21_14_0_10_54_11]
MHMRESEYTVDADARDFFINGYMVRPFKQDVSLERLLATLRELMDKPKKDGFMWEEKYKHTEDLKPNAYDYDSIFVDFLFAQGLPQYLNRVTGFNLMLGDVALRRFFPGLSYMGWHRDTHFYTGQKSAGRMPPIFKIIFYAALGEEPSAQLKVISGSHNRMFRTKLLDRAQTILARKASIKSSDADYFFFNSMIFHSVPSNITMKKPAIRLFYNFCQLSQLQHFPGHESLHKTYQQKLAQKPAAISPGIAVSQLQPAAAQPA